MEEVHRSSEAGFSNFVTKPIEIDKLLAAIDEVVSKLAELMS